MHSSGEGAALPLALTIAMGVGLLAQPASARSGSPVPVAQAAAANGKHTGPAPVAQSTTADTEHVAKGGQKASVLRLPKSSSAQVMRHVGTRGGCRQVVGVVVCRRG